MVQVAVIGAGIMGGDHAKIVAEDIPGTTLRVVCDVSEKRARAIADQYGAFDVMSDPFAVFSRKDVDAVIIASPDETHGQLCIAAVAAGKPVLCEKPLATNENECLKIVDAEVESGSRLIQVGYMRRYDRGYLEMKCRLENGDIGAPLLFHFLHRNVEAPPGFTGQMAISNSATHEFDVARYTFGSEIAWIEAFQPTGKVAGKIGAAVLLVLHMETGELVNIEVNNNAGYGYDVRGELVGEFGTIELRGPIHTEINRDLGSISSYSADWRPRFAEAYRMQNKDWIASIENGIPSKIGASAWDGYCAAAVGEMGVQSLRDGCRRAVNIAKKPALYG